MRESTFDPHEVLGVAPEASLAEIRVRFLHLAKLWHPDKRPAGESGEEQERARHEFISVHKAYETLMTSHEIRVSSFVLPESFRIPAQALEEVRDRRIEAEQYLSELCAATHSEGWSAEDEEALRRAWRLAFRAVEALKREEIAVQGMAEYAKIFSNNGVSGKDAGLQPELNSSDSCQGALDGPRSMTDVLDGVGAAVSELFFDSKEALFDSWASVCPRWLVSGFGSVGAPRKPSDYF